MGRVKSIDFVERVEAYEEWGKRYVLFYFVLPMLVPDVAYHHHYHYHTIIDHPHQITIIAITTVNATATTTGTRRSPKAPQSTPPCLVPSSTPGRT